MTLWLPLLDYGRSYAPLVRKVEAVTGPAACTQVLGLSNAQATALFYHGRMQLRTAGAVPVDCPWLIADSDALTGQTERLRSWGWQEVTRLRRPTDNNETLVIFAAGKP
jgi:hypothetical protein